VEWFVTRLILVSNRVQPPAKDSSGAQGGLAVALQAALREYSGFWFGWSVGVTYRYSVEIVWQTNYVVTKSCVVLV
jgi:trehalose 6-phosphate synthase